MYQRLTLGQLVNLLNKIKDKYNNDDLFELEIKYDFADFYPTEPESYRGYYDHLAFGYKNDRGNDFPKFIEFLKWSEESVGKVYEGYKGGKFLMGHDTPVWVSNWGECSDTVIIDVTDYTDIVILNTGYTYM